MRGLVHAAAARERGTSGRQDNRPRIPKPRGRRRHAGRHRSTGPAHTAAASTHLVRTRMARITYLTQIDLDFGAIRLLADECRRLGLRRPLVVTDPGVRAAGVLDRALAALDGWPVA